MWMVKKHAFFPFKWWRKAQGSWINWLFFFFLFLKPSLTGVMKIFSQHVSVSEFVLTWFLLVNLIAGFLGESWTGLVPGSEIFDHKILRFPIMVFKSLSNLHVPFHGSLSYLSLMRLSSCPQPDNSIIHNPRVLLRIMVHHKHVPTSPWSA